MRRRRRRRRAARAGLLEAPSQAAFRHGPTVDASRSSSSSFCNLARASYFDLELLLLVLALGRVDVEGRAQAQNVVVVVEVLGRDAPGGWVGGWVGWVGWIDVGGWIGWVE